MISTTDELSRLAEEAQDRKLIALDTEFVWERTFYPGLGLVQAGFSREEVYCIDTVALPDLSPLAPALEDSGVVKILHDAQQDLIILRRASGAFPKNVFDTRLASGFAGMRSSLSLQNLVREIVSIKLPKTETRTNWLRRPLSESQIEYALEDVRYLPELMNKLLSRAERRGHRERLDEELAALDNPTLYKDQDPDERYRKVKGAGKISQPKERAVLRAITAWREMEARRVDRPRGHVLTDDVLVAIARACPTTPNSLRAIRGISDKAFNRNGAKMIESVVDAMNRPPEEFLRSTERKNEDDKVSARTDMLLACLKGKSMKNGLDPALVGSRADVSQLANGDPCGIGAALMTGWRKSFIGDELIALMAGNKTMAIDPETGLPTIE